MAILEVRGLSRSFGGIQAADGVDLRIDDGDLLCLIGPNGAGKSTVFKLIMGLEVPDSGEVVFDGRDIVGLQPFQRVRLGLGMTYQATRTFANLTVGQNITIARRKGHGDGRLLAWALNYLGLDGRDDELASTLTYGQQHWLEICLALGTGPRIVMMDEPTAGMTPEETHFTATFLKELNGLGVTIMVIEHDIGFVKAVARRVSVLHQGRVFRDGLIEEIESDADVQRIYLGERRDSDAA